MRIEPECQDRGRHCGPHKQQDVPVYFQTYCDVYDIAVAPGHLHYSEVGSSWTVSSSRLLESEGNLYSFILGGSIDAASPSAIRPSVASSVCGTLCCLPKAHPLIFAHPVHAVHDEASDSLLQFDAAALQVLGNVVGHLGHLGHTCVRLRSGALVGRQGRIIRITSDKSQVDGSDKPISGLKPMTRTVDSGSLL